MSLLEDTRPDAAADITRGSIVNPPGTRGPAHDYEVMGTIEENGEDFLILEHHITHEELRAPRAGCTLVEPAPQT